MNKLIKLILETLVYFVLLLFILFFTRSMDFSNGVAIISVAVVGTMVWVILNIVFSKYIASRDDKA